MSADITTTATTDTPIKTPQIIPNTDANTKKKTPNNSTTSKANNNTKSNEKTSSNDSKSNDKSNTKSKPKSSPKKKNNSNNNNNNDNNNNNSKNDSDEDDLKISGKKDNSNLKSSSSYYHFKSTDPKEAEKFKPKKIENTTNTKTNAIQGASAWNTGATMETFDYTQWVFDQIKLEFCKIQFKDSNIKITEIDSIDGHATILYSRGKFRPGHDINLKAKFSGQFDEKDIEGTITMTDICMDDDDDDWEYEVSSKKGGPSGKKAARMIKNYRDTVISVLHVIFEEFKLKKQ